MAHRGNPLLDALPVQAALARVEVVWRVLTVLAHPALTLLAPRTLTTATQVLLLSSYMELCSGGQSQVQYRHYLTYRFTIHSVMWKCK